MENSTVQPKTFNNHMLMVKGTSVNFKGILGNIFKHSDNCKGWLQKITVL